VKDREYDILLYPNPARDIIFIKNQERNKKNLLAEIFNTEGKKLYIKNISEKDNSIEVSCFETSILIIKVFDTKGKALKSFKIQKIN
jgi:hypothetical protein